MDRVWILDEDLFAKKDSISAVRFAEVCFVKSFEDLDIAMDRDERPILLVSLKLIEEAQERYPRALSILMVPKTTNQDRITYMIRKALMEARLQLDLEASQSLHSGSLPARGFDDPSVEILGNCILEISSARNMDSVQRVLGDTCRRFYAGLKVSVIPHPESIDSRNVGFYQLAIPILNGRDLKAHVYVHFEGDPLEDEIERVSEVLINLSDALSLAIERNLMISRAEQTKTIWEASFDSVTDPIAITDASFKLLRANKAYSTLIGVGLEHLPGRMLDLVPEDLRGQLVKEHTLEKSVEIHGKHFRLSLDPMNDNEAGIDRYVFRFHDHTNERLLTEKLLAREQGVELGILVSSVAHEINNPIGGIIAICQLLLKQYDPKSERGGDIKNILDATERCKRIVQTMLSLVRKSEEKDENASLYSALKGALDILQSEASRLHIRVQLEAGESEKRLQLSANHSRLMQVFFHLIQQSLAAIQERQMQVDFDGYLILKIKAGFGNCEVEIIDNGDSQKHDYEIQSSVAFTVAKMILEEHAAQFYFSKQSGRNIQRIIFDTQKDIVW